MKGTAKRGDSQEDYDLVDTGKNSDPVSPAKAHEKVVEPIAPRSEKKLNGKLNDIEVIDQEKTVMGKFDFNFVDNEVNHVQVEDESPKFEQQQIESSGNPFKDRIEQIKKDLEQMKETKNEQAGPAEKIVNT